MRNKLLLLFCFNFIAGFIFSEELKNIRLDHISIQDGLPSGSISAIVQDPNGFIWFGTQGGLARYDGYNFKVFNQDPFRENSLRHNLIQTMYMDQDGSLWIGTYDGLDHFDPLTSRFTKVDDENSGVTLTNNVVVSILKDSRQRLWVGTMEGLNILQDDRTFKHFLKNDKIPGTLANNTIRAITEDNAGTIWFATYGGISSYNEQTETFANYLDTAVMAIAADPDGEYLWLGTWADGLIKFNIRTHETEYFKIPDANIYSLRFNSDGKLWIGSWGAGLTIFNTDNYEYTTFTTENSEDLSHDIIYSLFEDRSGVVWIGTNGGGVNTFVGWHNRFKYYQNEGSETSTLSQGKVYAITKNNEDMWVGIYGRGINRINIETGEIKYYKNNPEDPSSLSDNIVNEILTDSKNRLWLATQRGLCLYMPETDNFKRYYNPEAPENVSENIFYRIFEDNDGKIWIGTYNSGLFVFDPEDESFISFKHNINDPQSLSNNIIRDIIQDHKGVIWAATSNGLNRLNPDLKTFTRFKHGKQGTISSNDIRSLFVDENNNIWAGTVGGGISILNTETETFSYITKKDGLLSNIIIGISEPENGELWIAEQFGISIISTKHKSIRQITTNSGLLEGELTSNIGFSNENTIWIGGTEGITVIPREFTNNHNYIPDVRITKLEINGSLFKNASSVIRNGRITLNHNQNNINIELNSDDYSSPDQNQFTYKLIGLDSDWSQPDKRNYVNYTNLSPGKYEFAAKGSGSRDNWSESSLSLSITVKPHPAESPAARILYTIIFIIILFLITRRFSKKQKERAAGAEEQIQLNKELEKRVIERTSEIQNAMLIAKEATKAKSLFLANMSHEIRTPLNGIIGMLALLKKTPTNEEQQQYLDYSQLSAHNLLTLLDEILNYEKMTSGKTSLNEDIFSITDIADYTRTLYIDRMKDKGIEFRLDIDTDIPAFLRGDSRKLMRIINNLISNAVKYTESGFIELSINGSLENDLCNTTITVKDSGRGIPEDKLNKIFDSFEQLDSSYTKTQRGVGLGLAIVDGLVKMMKGTINVTSKENHGTTFTVKLSFPLAAEKPEETQQEASKVPESARPLKIMIVEDEAINRLYTTKLLKDNKFDYIDCSNGKEAVNKYQSYKPDIILMDIGMPEMNGIEAVQNIREQEKSMDHHALIIMLSAHVYSDDIKESLSSGADDFLAKPFNEQDFLQCIKKWSKKTNIKT